MISFIIPTLWKSDCIYKTIDMVKASKFGIELIIIDNNDQGYKSDHNRIKVIKPGSNIYVNPAWNLGIQHASMPYSCLLNDDISLNIELLCRSFHRDIINSNIKENLGMIAYESGKGFDETINDNTDLLTLKELNTMGHGFGQLMIFKTDMYCPIPESLKIFFGDNILFYAFHNVLKLKVYCFDGLKTIGKVSVSSAEYEHKIQEELPYFEQSVKSVYNYYKLK